MWVVFSLQKRHPTWLLWSFGNRINNLWLCLHYNCRLQHDIIQSCGSVPWPWNMSLVFHGLLNRLGIFVYYSYIHASLGNLSGVILLALCVGLIVHPKNICRIHCSSQYYSQNLLLIKELSLKTPTLFMIVLLFKSALFIIRNGVSFLLFSKFLSMKVKEWKPISIAKYRIEHNHTAQ